VMGMATAPPPQLKVTVPPPARAESSAASVQLAAVPLPTTPPARAEGTAHPANASTTKRGFRAAPPPMRAP
jgi:hypothetical protein